LGLARLAEAAERYSDMVHFMNKLVHMRCEAKKDLSIDERNLLSVGYKNVVGQLRNGIRSLAGADTSEDPKAAEKFNAAYKAMIESELKSLCEEMTEMVEKKLIKADVKSIGKDDMEEQVFYMKMCGDYFRYLAENMKNQDYRDKCEEWYKKAWDAASDKEKGLPETNPTRLGLALNFSVCYYEILEKRNEACGLAKEAFDGAIEKLDTLNDASYKDSTLIMQLLRDNLTLWNSENDQGGAEKDGADPNLKI